MRPIFEFINLHAALGLSALVVLMWYLHLFTSRPRSPLRLLVFPLAHWRAVADVRENVATMPIMLAYLLFMGGVASLIHDSLLTSLIVWCLLLLYELFAITAYFLKSRNQRALVICSLLILLVIGYGAYRTILAEWDFQIMNNYDFAGQIVLFLGSVLAIAIIIVKDRFAQEVDAFFVFFGLTIYSFLQSLSTIMLAFNFFANANFPYYTTLITLVFWLMSVPWIRRLKSRLT